jgi:hypothetical protein
MDCAAKNSFCTGNIKHRVFIWRYIHPKRNSDHLHIKNIPLPCILCDHHHNRILEENNGVIPETRGQNEVAALENLLGAFEAEADTEFFYAMDTESLDTCTCCTNDAITKCDDCSRSVCLSCLSYGGRQCCSHPS